MVWMCLWLCAFFSLLLLVFGVVGFVVVVGVVVVGVVAVVRPVVPHPRAKCNCHGSYNAACYGLEWAALKNMTIDCNRTAFLVLNLK